MYGLTEYFQTAAGNGREEYRMRLGVDAEIVHLPPELFRLTLSGVADMPCPSDLLFRRDHITALGGFEEDFKGEFGMHEDQAFLTKVFLHTNVFVSQKMWDRYRLHTGSMCALGDQLVSEQNFLAWLEKYIRAQGVVDDEIWEMIGKRSWRNRHPRLAALRKRLRRVLRPTDS